MDSPGNPQTDILNARLVPSPLAAESRVGEETVILHTGSGTYFGLDPVGTRIWQMLQEGMTTATICDAIAEAYGIDPRSARADVASFLADLRAHDIVIEAP